MRLSKAVGDVIAIATHADSVVNQRRVSRTPPEGELEVFKIVKSDKLLHPVQVILVELVFLHSDMHDSGEGNIPRFGAAS